MPQLPQFDSLYVFSVAARHLSFTAAAAELHRTQSAVSHRIKALEAELGVPLFIRLTRRLVLTAAGQALARQVNQAIADIARTIAELDKVGETRSIRVTTLPSVASRWLMPRMSRFLDLHPDIEVHVIADSRPLDLRVEDIDLAIRFGRGRYPGHSTSLLMRDRVLPVCSPAFIAERGPIATLDALLELPLLHDSAAEGDGSLSDWQSWFDQLGRKDAPCHAGQRFSNAALLIEAAALGLGVALGRFSLVADHFSTGTLICPLPLATATAFSYYLVALSESAALPNIVRFRHWLRAEAAATVSAAPPLHTGALTGY
jgi:LysR family transcriptional regulator, glycine cleavage system transcriptional activator